jgi:hypothetical protein
MLGDITNTLQQDSGLSPSDYATLTAWIQAQPPQGRVVTHYPTGPLAGAIATRLAVQDPTLSDPNDYRFAPSNIILLDAMSSGGSLDFSGQAARLAMMYSDTVSNAVGDVASAIGTGLVSSPIIWGAAAVVALYWIVTNPEKSRAGYAKGKAYVQRWRS